MTTLVLHILWSILYLIFLFNFNIIKILFFKNKSITLKPNSKNFITNLLLIFFFNTNLSFCKNTLNLNEITVIEKERFKNWPTLTVIHSNINKFNIQKTNNLTLSTSSLITNWLYNNVGFFYSKNNKFKRIHKFKYVYKSYKTINNEFNILSFGNNTVNSKVLFIIIYNLVFKKFKKFINNNNFRDYMYAVFMFRGSISNSNIVVNTYNLNTFNDYINYLDTTENFKSSNKTLFLVNNTKNTDLVNINLFNFKLYTKLVNFVTLKKNYFYLLTINKFFKLNTNFNINFLNSLKKKYKVVFSASSIVKYLSDYSTSNSVILYLRKNKIFNKSRYSRNRQTYRTGAYWCLYINIIAVIAFYFWFYRFTINFGYLWWILYSFILSLFFLKAFKYKLYNPVRLLNEILLGLNWLILIIIILITPILSIFKNIKFEYKYYQDLILYEFFEEMFKNNTILRVYTIVLM